jgi:hypothetical protein
MAERIDIAPADGDRDLDTERHGRQATGAGWQGTSRASYP